MLSRREFLSMTLAGSGLARPAFAQDDPITRGVVRQLEEQGFAVAELRRTWLGRIRVLARRGALTRELVIDPRNGAILRDFVSRGAAGPRVPDIGDYDETGDDADEDDDGADDDRDDDDDDDGDRDDGDHDEDDADEDDDGADDDRDDDDDDDGDDDDDDDD